MFRSRRIQLTHGAAFLVGAISACTLGTIAQNVDWKARYTRLDDIATALFHIESSYVDEVKSDVVVAGAIAGMTSRLDRYSTYLPPSRYARSIEDTEGEYASVGLVIGPGTSDEPGQPPYPWVDEVLPGSPADAAGLHPDDRLVSVDDVPTTAGGKETQDASKWEAALRGATGTRVRLQVLRTNESKPLTLELVRARTKAPSVRGEAIADGIGYVAVTRFTESTKRDVEGALTALAQAQSLHGLVLDLRRNPGGIVAVAIDVADLFLEKGVIVATHNRAFGTQKEIAHGPDRWQDYPMVVLVDAGTASAAEIVTGALGDNQRATIVGEQTYGKGTVQTFFPLPGGGGLKLTTARYMTPSGKPIDKTGIMPHVVVGGFAPETIDLGKTQDVTKPSGTGTRLDVKLNELRQTDPQLAEGLRLLKAQLSKSLH